VKEIMGGLNEKDQAPRTRISATAGGREVNASIFKQGRRKEALGKGMSRALQGKGRRDAGLEKNMVKKNYVLRIKVKGKGKKSRVGAKDISTST